MSFEDFLYRVAHGYPGAVPALAARMGKNPTVLMHKLNPNTSTHGVMANEAEQIIDLTNSNFSAAELFAGKAHAVVVQLIECHGSDVELLDAFMDVIKELGMFSAEFQRDWADGHITPAEFRRLTKEAARFQSTILSFMARVEQLVDKPHTHLHQIK